MYISQKYLPIDLSYDVITTPICERGNVDVCISSIDRNSSLLRSWGVVGCGCAVLGTKSTWDMFGPNAPSVAEMKNFLKKIF